MISNTTIIFRLLFASMLASTAIGRPDERPAPRGGRIFIFSYFDIANGTWKDNASAGGDISICHLCHRHLCFCLYKMTLSETLAIIDV